MIQKTVLLLSLLLSACQPIAAWNQQDSRSPKVIKETCQVSADKILSCLASSKQLSSNDLSSEFDSLINSSGPKPDSEQLNRLLCLTLHPDTSIEQLQKGETILKDLLRTKECNQESLTGLLFIIQGNITIHNNYLNKNWRLHLKKKALLKKEEDINQELDHEITSYQLRIQDLEKQVQKLKEIESMLDKKVSP